MDEKSWRTWKSNLKIVMDEELDENIVMGKKIVKNFVMDVKIYSKVEMDLTILKISGWNILQHSKRKLFEESIKQNELQLLLIGIPSRDSFLMIQYLERHVASVGPIVKESMPLTENIHVTTQLLHATARCFMKTWTPTMTYIVERIYGDEMYEHSDGIFQDAIRIEWILVEDNGFLH